MEKNLPEVLYVVRREEDDGEYVWFSAEEELESLAERGEVKVVGVYKLEKLLSVTLEVKEEVIVNEVK